MKRRRKFLRCLALHSQPYTAKYSNNIVDRISHSPGQELRWQRAHFSLKESDARNRDRITSTDTQIAAFISITSNLPQDLTLNQEAQIITQKLRRGKSSSTLLLSIGGNYSKLSRGCKPREYKSGMKHDNCLKCL